MVSNLGEDCIMALGRSKAAMSMEDIASAMELDEGTIRVTVTTLEDKGYLRVRPDGMVHITNRGRRFAEVLMRRHQLLESFLGQVLDLDTDEVHHEACSLEHKLSDESVDRISRMICPKGRGTRPCWAGDAEVTPLSELDQGGRGEIVFLRCEDKARISRLVSMGLVPGREVVLENEYALGGPLLIRVGDCRMALSRELVGLVMVRRI